MAGVEDVDAIMTLTLDDGPVRRVATLTQTSMVGGSSESESADVAVLPF